MTEPSSKLEVIRHIIEVHHTLRKHVKLVGESVSDLEALFSLRGQYAGWTQSSLEKIVEQRDKLQQTLNFLEEGLRNHFAYEEKTLPDILGETMMKGLMVEHNGVRQEVAAAKSVVFGTKLEGMSRDEIILQKSLFQQAIDNLSSRVEKHASREEIVLDMAREALEEG